MISTCNKITAQVQLYRASCKEKKSRIVGNMQELRYPHGFFDGATTLKISGAGIFIGISESHSLSIKMGCGLSNKL